MNEPACKIALLAGLGFFLAAPAAAQENRCAPGTHDFDGTCVADVQDSVQVKTYTAADCDKECPSGQSCVPTTPSSQVAAGLFVCIANPKPGCFAQCALPPQGCHYEREGNACSCGRLVCQTQDGWRRLLRLVENLPPRQRREALDFLQSLNAGQLQQFEEFVGSLNPAQFRELRQLLRDPNGSELERFFGDLSADQRSQLWNFFASLTPSEQAKLLALLRRHWHHWRSDCGPNILACRQGLKPVCGADKEWTCQPSDGHCPGGCPGGQVCRVIGEASGSNSDAVLAGGQIWGCTPGVCDPSGPAPHCPQGQAQWDGKACKWACPAPEDRCHGKCAANQRCERAHCGWASDTCSAVNLPWQCTPQSVCVLDCAMGYHPVYRTQGSCDGATCQPNEGNGGGSWCGCGPAGRWLQPGETCPDQCRYTM